MDSGPPREPLVRIPMLRNSQLVGGLTMFFFQYMLQAGIYQRSNPDYTDQVETVEIWKRIDDKHMGADVWVYDPPALVEPWYTKQSYLKLSDPDKSLRIRYWNCGENQNNSVQQTKEGATEFRNLTFTKKGDKQGDKP